MVPSVSASRILRRIVTGLLFVAWLVGVGLGGTGAPGLTASCQKYFYDPSSGYITWVKANPNNYLKFTLVSNQSNQAVTYDEHVPLTFSPAIITIFGSVDLLVGSTTANGVVNSSLDNWKPYFLPNDIVGHPFDPNQADRQDVTIALNGQITLTSTNLGNITFTFDCNPGVIIGQSTNPWSTTILISLEKATKPPNK